MNLVLFFVAHAAIKYYLLHIYRNKRGTNQLFLVTTTDRVKDTLAAVSYTHLSCRTTSQHRKRACSAGFIFRSIIRRTSWSVW